MSYKDWRVRVDDMLEAIQRCVTYVTGIDEKTFAGDQRTIDAVARNLEVIGEAANKVPSNIREQYPLVPWGKLAEMRHVLIHEYHSVDADILYRTVINDLPPLITMLGATLEGHTEAVPSVAE